MKALFDREGLHAAVQVAGSVVPSRSPKPILQNIKLTVTKNGATLSATDLEAVGVVLEVRGVQVERPGAALLPVGQTNQILRETTDQELQLDADENRTMVVGQYAEFELPGEDPAQYPDVPQFEGDDYHQIQASELKEMVGRTIFAVAQESARYALTGVLWELGPEKCRLVGTDGRRLAVCDGVGIQHGKHSTEGQTPVVPTKAMSLLERNLTDPEEPVFVCIRGNDSLFKTSRATIYGRLVEGRYPPYREVFPKKSGSKVALNVGKFLSTVRQAAIVTDEDSRGVDFSFTKDKLTLNARVADKGRAKIELPIDFQGKALDVTFDPRFMIDMLRVLDVDAELTLTLVDSSSPALFQSGDKYSYIIMPLSREGR